jgi:threonine dehydrogenase-like Zn-dependent dehydrogenase
MAITFTTWYGGKDGPVAKTINHSKSLTGHQVYVKTSHSGICGTDVHYYHQDMGLGHEGVGVIAEVGPESRHKVGDRVAWGWVIAILPLC